MWVYLKRLHVFCCTGWLGAESRACSVQCAGADGCWGPSDAHCRRCANYRLYDSRCVAQCNASVIMQGTGDPTTLSLYVANTSSVQHDAELQCRLCHPQCNGTCYADVCSGLVFMPPPT